MPKFCSVCGTEVTQEEGFCQKCGFYLKGIIQTRKSPAATPTKEKSPVIAAILNFLIAGVGYIYLGKWAWGILAFIFIYGVLSEIFISFSDFFMDSLLYLPIRIILSSILGWHAYKLAEKINKESGFWQEVIPSSIVEYAGFWRRFVATFIDMIIINIIDIIIIVIIFGFIYALSPRTTEGFEVLSFISILSVNWIYFAGMESSSKQATFGKMAFGIVVTDLNGNRISFGRATIRHFAQIISALILFFGFLMIGFSGKKQGLHDMIAGCLIIMKK